MASVRKKPNSRFWIACFTDHNGHQRQRSTGVAEKSDAIRIALAFEDAYRRKMTEQQVRRVLNDACEAINGRRFATATVSEFLKRWLARKKAETTASTGTRYGEAIRRFEAYLGPERCAQEVCRLGVSDFSGLRDHLVTKVRPGTASKPKKGVTEQHIRDVFDNGDSFMLLKAAADKLQEVAGVGRTVAYEALKVEGGEFSRLLCRRKDKTIGLLATSGL